MLETSNRERHAVNLSLRGQDEQERRFRNMASNIKPTLERLTQKAVLYVHSTVPPYPAPPATSTYRRTGTLGRTITTEVRSLGVDVVGVIGTKTIYAPWVIDEKRQAWMHKGRWWTLQGVVAKAKSVIVDIYRIGLREIFNK
jgi:hypothetical protein